MFLNPQLSNCYIYLYTLKNNLAINFTRKNLKSITIAAMMQCFSKIKQKDKCFDLQQFFLNT